MSSLECTNGVFSTRHEMGLVQFGPHFQKLCRSGLQQVANPLQHMRAPVLGVCFCFLYLRGRGLAYMTEEETPPQTLPDAKAKTRMFPKGKPKGGGYVCCSRASLQLFHLKKKQQEAELFIKPEDSQKPIDTSKPLALGFWSELPMFYSVKNGTCRRGGV